MENAGHCAALWVAAAMDRALSPQRGFEAFSHLCADQCEPTGTTEVFSLKASVICSLFLQEFWSVTGIQAKATTFLPEGASRDGPPREKQIHGAFQALCTQKRLTVTVCAMSSPWLNIFLLL